MFTSIGKELGLTYRPCCQKWGGWAATVGVKRPLECLWKVACVLFEVGCQFNILTCCTIDELPKVCSHTHIHAHLARLTLYNQNHKRITVDRTKKVYDCLLKPYLVWIIYYCRKWWCLLNLQKKHETVFTWMPSIIKHVWGGTMGKNGTSSVGAHINAHHRLLKAVQHENRSGHVLIWCMTIVEILPVHVAADIQIWSNHTEFFCLYIRGSLCQSKHSSCFTFTC